MCGWCAELDRNDWGLLRVLVMPIGVGWHALGGSRLERVECCALPGTGKLLITGIELNRHFADKSIDVRVSEDVVSKPCAPPCPTAHAHVNLTCGLLRRGSTRFALTPRALSA